MLKWLASNGLSLFTLISMAFFAGISYGDISETKGDVKTLQFQVDANTKALIEIVTELRLKREADQKERGR